MATKTKQNGKSKDVLAKLQAFNDELAGLEKRQAEIRQQIAERWDDDDSELHTEVGKITGKLSAAPAARERLEKQFREAFTAEAESAWHDMAAQIAADQAHDDKLRAELVELEKLVAEKKAELQKFGNQAARRATDTTSWLYARRGYLDTSDSIKRLIAHFYSVVDMGRRGTNPSTFELMLNSKLERWEISNETLSQLEESE